MNKQRPNGRAEGMKEKSMNEKYKEGREEARKKGKA